MNKFKNHDNSPNKNKWIYIPIIISSFLIFFIILLMSYYFCINNYKVFHIYSPEDAIQISILCALIANALFIILYVYFTKEQVDELITSNRTPVIKFLLLERKINKEIFERENSDIKNLQIPIQIENITRNPIGYYIRIKPYYKKNENEIEIIEDLIIESAYKEKIFMFIQPSESINGYFTIKLDKFIEILENYMSKNLNKFNNKSSKSILIKYLNGKYNYTIFPPDPIGFFIRIKSKNKYMEKYKYDIDMIYYFSMRYDTEIRYYIDKEENVKSKFIDVINFLLIRHNIVEDIDKIKNIFEN